MASAQRLEESAGEHREVFLLNGGMRAATGVMNELTLRCDSVAISITTVEDHDHGT